MNITPDEITGLVLGGVALLGAVGWVVDLVLTRRSRLTAEEALDAQRALVWAARAEQGWEWAWVGGVLERRPVTQAKASTIRRLALADLR